MRKIRLLLIIAGIMPIITACSGKEKYGLCIISPEETVGVNAGSFFPMYSVVKFPQALYVADYLQRNDISLDSAVVVRKSELMQDTWSPMLEGMDESRTFSFRELLRLSLVESDNNACDLLFKLCGMPEVVDSFIKGLGFNDINIAVTERQMHDDIALAAANYCTPSEMARLFLWFEDHKDDNAYYREIWDKMSACNTGADRIPAAFGADCKIVHKTGTGFTPENGLPQMNDAGIVILPDGQMLAIAIFVPYPITVSELSEIVKRHSDEFLE